jgi:hypothetical protein
MERCGALPSLELVRRWMDDAGVEYLRARRRRVARAGTVERRQAPAQRADYASPPTHQRRHQRGHQREWPEESRGADEVLSANPS